MTENDSHISSCAFFMHPLQHTFAMKFVILLLLVIVCIYLWRKHRTSTVKNENFNTLTMSDAIMSPLRIIPTDTYSLSTPDHVILV